MGIVREINGILERNEARKITKDRQSMNSPSELGNAGETISYTKQSEYGESLSPSKQQSRGVSPRPSSAKPNSKLQVV